MSKYKIIIVGCGNISNNWLSSITKRADADIVALVDIIPSNAEIKKKEYGLDCKIFTQLEEAIATTNANMVCDLTTPAHHYSVVSTAIQAGCHVLGEKPMANSMEEVNDIVKLVNDHDGFYAVMQNRRYLKGFRGFKELLTKETLGEVGYLGVNFFLGPHFGGFRELMDSPLILDMAIHTFDQARFLINAKPISVYCQEYNPKGSWYKGNASAICIFEFDNGCVLNYTGSWCAHGISTPWEGQWRVQGSKGTAVYIDENNMYAEVIDETNKTKKVLPGFSWNEKTDHAGCIDEMFESVIKGKKSDTDCRDNRYSMAMVFGAIKSAKKERKIYLSKEIL
ncbi:Gfo/Idh/MocA family protein [Vallitalea okinawensis]|uniref:Gfo/Idh/MocA family protein n=1 Tax=Vallitalea okinawensis TaxID=2078660 RepID=UPI000CFCA0B7|nr:Gfo/Idh/MocA family oxidoreductase [Vallitalea okinawensis]